MKINSTSKNLALTAMFMAIGIVLPFFTGQIKLVGNMLLPMHLPVMLCGLICGPWYGLAAGVCTPLIRSMIFGMPPMFPTAAAMMFELAAYGAVLGFLYSKSKWKCVVALLRCMITAMICGRIVWGAVMAVFMGITGNIFTMKAFFAGAFLNAIPGIIIQLILIPVVMTILGKAHIVVFSKNKKEHMANGTQTNQGN